MNARQLAKLGVSSECVPAAISSVQKMAKWNRTVEKIDRMDIKHWVQECLKRPDELKHDSFVGELARAAIEEQEFVRPEPIGYKVWGEDGIDEGSHQQMVQACSLPMATGAALMPDAHLGYGLPIGGVLALENAVVPFAVGVDIACRMKLSVYDVKPLEFEKRRNIFRESLMGGTVFGIGNAHQTKQHHEVLDDDWTITRVTREQKDRAWAQLGTSGSGNHFVEFGILTLKEKDVQLGLEAGEYVALLSHSGSRGAGAAVAKFYSGVASSQLSKRYSDLGRLAWLDMDTEAGQEYWAAMNLMGRYASANHAVIHREVSRLLGRKPIAGVENHHNFAFSEFHGGKNVIVHRKGATPAGKGVLGVIPGSMADPAYVVRGKGNPDSLDSASHGAGRVMSRKKAKEKFNWNATKKNLAARGVEVLSAGADEVPGVYKNIDEVMAAQTDLVEIVARFDPRLVRMCGDDSRAED